VSEHWGEWSYDEPELDDVDLGDSTDPASEHDPDADYPVEGFGPADGLSTDDGVTGGDDDLTGPAGGAQSSFDVDEPIGYGDDTAADPDPGAESGMGPAGDVPTGSGTDGAQTGFGPAGPPLGADPDLSPYADDSAWTGADQPPALDLDQAPEPVDGYPWADPALLGTAPVDAYAEQGAVTDERPDPAELADYASMDLAGADPWTALISSEDPATRALARFWAPEGGVSR
jgi:hypothetical protein